MSKDHRDIRHKREFFVTQMRSATSPGPAGILALAAPVSGGGARRMLGVARLA